MLNKGNQYEKDATQVVPGITAKFDESYNLIPRHIDESKQEHQMKYQKIIQALDRFLYLTGKQGISYQETQKPAVNSAIL